MKRKKHSKRPVLIFEEHDCGEGPEVFFLGHKKEGDRFFGMLLANVEKNQNHKIRLEDWTKKQCDDAKEHGDFMAGEMSEAREEKYVAKLKRRNQRKQRK